jgi:hypothetical protein
MSEATQMFEDAIGWLRDAYDDRPFFVERDVVYTVQLRLWEANPCATPGLVGIQRLPDDSRTASPFECRPSDPFGRW